MVLSVGLTLYGYVTGHDFVSNQLKGTFPGGTIVNSGARDEGSPATRGMVGRLLTSRSIVPTY